MTTTTTPAQLLASEKQTALIARLLGEKDVPADCATWIRTQLDCGISKKNASHTISYLFTLPRTTAAPAEGAPAPVTEVGIYERDGEVYKVQASRGSGNLYAKQLVVSGAQRLTEAGEVVKGTFEYAPGALRKLTADDKVTLERAKELGHLTGICIVCGAHLEDAKSVAAGIGPVCAKRV